MYDLTCLEGHNVELFIAELNLFELNCTLNNLPLLWKWIPYLSWIMKRLPSVEMFIDDLNSFHNQ